MSFVHTSSPNTRLSWLHAGISGVFVGLLLVGAQVWAYTAPAGSPPSNNAVTPLYTTTTQTTSNLGIKRQITPEYPFVVDGKSQITTGTLYSAQSIIIDSDVNHAFLPGVLPSILDIQGTLNATGPLGGNPGNIQNQGIDNNDPSYTLAISSFFTNSDPVCATQDGVLVRCTGCTDPTALNFDPAAVTDDGSCTANAYHWEYGPWGACQSDYTCGGSWQTFNYCSGTYGPAACVTNTDVTSCGAVAGCTWQNWQTGGNINLGVTGALGICSGTPTETSSCSDFTNATTCSNHETCTTHFANNYCSASSPQTASACTTQNGACSWNASELYSLGQAVCQDALGNTVSSSLCDLDELGNYIGTSQGYFVPSAVMCNGLSEGDIPVDPTIPTTGGGSAGGGVPTSTTTGNGQR